MLLHLLSNIVTLPVTKSTVKTSGMGKAIGSVEKHRLCNGTPHETAIRDRVQEIKDSWHSSVKARKSQDERVKRQSDEPSASSPAKRVKAEIEPRKSSTFTALLKKVSGLSNGANIGSGPGASGANEQWLKSSAVVSLAEAKTNSKGGSVDVDIQTNNEGMCGEVGLIHFQFF